MAGKSLNRLSLEPLPPPEPELAEALRRAALTMEAQAFDPATGLLDYARLAGSASLQAYRQQARALWAFDPSVLETPSQRLAFWINLYNALMVDAVISFEVKRTVREIPGIFWRAAYGVGGRRYSLDDIEHGILRSNAGHPAIPGARFSAADPRQRFVLPCLEPRIHYALNCASRSCPPSPSTRLKTSKGNSTWRRAPSCGGAGLASGLTVRWSFHGSSSGMRPISADISWGLDHAGR